jgi:PAS domain S-box-containing protein
MMLEQYIEAIENNNIVSKTDINGIITFVNDEFCKISKYSRDELIGKNHNIVRHPDIPPSHFKKLWNTILAKQTYKATVKNLAKDGSVFYVNTTIFPILDDYGNIIEFVAIRYDVTKATNIAEKLKHRDRLMYQQARLASMGEMIANIAHQWRQPLSELGILLYGMKKEHINCSENEKFNIQYDKSKNLIKQMSQTIDDFRNFFSPNKPKEHFFVCDIIDEVMFILKDTLKNEHIHVDIVCDKEIKLFGYANELSHVLINILNNAKDAYCHISTKSKLINISAKQNSKSIQIKISDNGIGIPKNRIDKVFEPYFTTKHSSHGTGLGLYMVKLIVEDSMNGKIEVKNNEKSGVCFTITFKKEKDL